MKPQKTSNLLGFTPSCVHKNFSPNVEKYKVRNVYDGDTLTLVDERHVYDFWALTLQISKNNKPMHKRQRRTPNNVAIKRKFT